MLNGGLVGLQAILDQLKPSERKVADYILAHPEDVVKLSVQKLAEYSGVSEATIIRLARSLNMKGYQELKLRVAGDLTKQTAMGSYQEIMMEVQLNRLCKRLAGTIFNPFRIRSQSCPTKK